VPEVTVPPVGTRILLEEVSLEATITEFRETEVFAVSDDGTEYRIDPRDFFDGKVRLAG
jgi:hypothetical protein